MKKIFLNSSLFFSIASINLIPAGIIPTSFAQEVEIKASQERKKNSVNRVEVIEKTIQLLNRMANPAKNFDKSELEKYFSNSFKVKMNGKITATTYDKISNYFEKLRASGVVLEVQIPFQEVLTVKNKKNKLVTRYNIHVTGQDGKLVKIISGTTVWTFEDSRIKMMDEIVNESKEIKNEEKNQATLLRAFKFFEGNFTDEQFYQSFDEGVIQYFNNEVNDAAQFRNRLRAFGSRYASIKVIPNQIIAKDDIILASFIVKIFSHDGTVTEQKSLAQYHFNKDNKIQEFHVLSIPIVGTAVPFKLGTQDEVKQRPTFE